MRPATPLLAPTVAEGEAVKEGESKSQPAALSRPPQVAMPCSELPSSPQSSGGQGREECATHKGDESGGGSVFCLERNKNREPAGY